MSNSSKNNNPHKTRVSKKEWLIEALDALAVGGIEAVVIERLAARLQISKSGFYWHFKDRQELLIELLCFWSEEYTEVVTKKSWDPEINPASKLYTIAQMVYKFDLAKYDLAIRTWAKNDPLAKRAVQRVNKLRLDLIRPILSEVGFKGDELEMRTRLFVCYVSFEVAMFGKINQKQWEALTKRRIQLLISK